MADEQPQIVQTPVEPTTASNVHPAVGLPDRAPVLDSFGQPTGEIVVYEYAPDGAYLGWHKEQA